MAQRHFPLNRDGRLFPEGLEDKMHGREAHSLDHVEHRFLGLRSWENRIIGMIANFPITIPYCVSFKPCPSPWLG